MTDILRSLFHSPHPSRTTSKVSAHSAKPTHRRKRRAVDFNSCVVPVELPTDVPQRLVQIHANAAELRRRLNCFVDQKRDEINQNNVQDFIEPADPACRTATGDDSGGGAESEEMSCARIRSSVYRSKDASSHLRSMICGRLVEQRLLIYGSPQTQAQFIG